MQIAQPNYYSILGIPTPRTPDDPSLTPEALKSAYRRALLRHHPDRRPGEKVVDNDNDNDKSTFTVDQIIQAYEVLVDPVARGRYHQGVLESRKGSALGTGVERSAVETVDLEELECKELDQGGGAVWQRVCRCGGLYQVSEKQLEEVAGDGEIVVGCRGCSLFIRVVFDVVEG